MKLFAHRHMQTNSEGHGVHVIDLTNEPPVSKHSSVIAVSKRQYVGWPALAPTQQCSSLVSGSVASPGEGNFRIPSSILEEAKANNRSWSFKLYRGPFDETVRVHYCANLQESERIARLFLSCTVLGFDMEWCTRSRNKDYLKRNISVVQIASEREIAVFHLAVHEGSGVKQILAPSLQRILESTSIIKCGVCAEAVDGARLEKFMKIKPAGLLELSRLQNLTHTGTEAPGGREFFISLAKLVSRNLDLWLDKGPVRTSDWTKPLTEKQIDYASSDAYAGYMIFEALDRKRLKMWPSPPLPKPRTPQEAKAKSWGSSTKNKAAGSPKTLGKTVGITRKKNDVPYAVASVNIVSSNTPLENDQSKRCKRPKFVHPLDIPSWQAPMSRVALGELQPSRFINRQDNLPSENSHMGCSAKSSGQRALYQFLVRLRDDIGESACGSFYEIVSDKTLTELAARRPRNLQELVRVPGAGLLYKHAKARGTSLLESIDYFADPLCTQT